MGEMQCKLMKKNEARARQLDTVFKKAYSTQRTDNETDLLGKALTHRWFQSDVNNKIVETICTKDRTKKQTDLMNDALTKGWFESGVLHKDWLQKITTTPRDDRTKTE